MSNIGYHIYYRGISMHRHISVPCFTLAFSYGLYDWNSDNEFVGFYDEQGELLQINHFGSHTFHQSTLSQTCDEAWSDIECKFTDAISYSTNKHIIQGLKPFLTTNLKNPCVDIVDMNERHPYMDIYFTLNQINNVEFCYLLSKEYPERCRISKVITDRIQSEEKECLTFNFFGDMEMNVITQVINHPKVRLKSLLFQ